MKIPEGSGCAECANCLIVGDRTEYLCNDNDRAAGEDCRRFVSRDSEPPSLIYGISTTIAGADAERVGLELIVVLLLGFVPDSWPFQLSQVSINFICSMQYNTFRQAEHIPMSTTFCTNHVRQVGVLLTRGLRHREDASIRRRFRVHVLMLCSFAAGAVVSTVACRLFGGRAIWGAGILLLIVFADLAHADRTKEKDLLYRKPAGH